MRPLVGARRRPVVPVLEGAHAVVEPPDDAAGGGGGRAVGGRRRGEEGDVGGKRGRGELGGGGLAGLEVVWGRGGGGEGGTYAEALGAHAREDDPACGGGEEEEEDDDDDDAGGVHCCGRWGGCRVVVVGKAAGAGAAGDCDGDGKQCRNR